jgi:hypothetical protein
MFEADTSIEPGLFDLRMKFVNLRFLRCSVERYGIRSPQYNKVTCWSSEKLKAGRNETGLFRRV